MKNTFSDKINQFESPVPEELFDKIMVRQKKKKGAPPWYWLMVVLAFLSIFGISYALTSSQKQLANTSDFHKKNQTTTETNSANTNTRKEIAHTTNVNKNTQKKQQPQTKRLLQSKTVKPNNFLVPKTNEKNNTVKFNINSSAEATESGSYPSIIQENVSNIKNRRTVFEIKTPQFPSKLGSLSSPTPLTTEAIPTKTTRLTQALPILQNTLSIAVEPYFQAPDCYGFSGKKARLKIFLEALYSPDYVQSKLTSKKTEFDSYRDDRAHSEKSVFSYSTQFGIGLKTKKGIVFRTGLNYSIHESKFYKKDPSYTKITTVKVYDGNGNYLRTDTKTEVGFWEIQQYNQQKYYDIPVSIGYITNFNKFNFGFNVGGQFNIKTESSGRFLGSDGQVTSFLISQAKQTPAYQEKIGIQGIANLIFTYSLGNHLNLVLAPHAKYTPKSITTTEYPLIEKQLTMGLWAGARYQF